MRKSLLVVLMALSAFAMAGNCTYPDDIAADGSVCGGRAASVRPSGYEPPPENAASTNSDFIQSENMGFGAVMNVVKMGVNTYPDDVEFNCNGDLNIAFNAGRYTSSVETSEVPNNWYEITLIAHNHYLGDMKHDVNSDGSDIKNVKYHFDDNDTGYLTIGQSDHALEFSTLRVDYVNGKAISASFKSSYDKDFNYQCKRINVENPWKA